MSMSFFWLFCFFCCFFGYFVLFCFVWRFWSCRWLTGWSCHRGKYAESTSCQAKSRSWGGGWAYIYIYNIYIYIIYLSQQWLAGTSTVCNRCRRRNDAGEDGHLKSRHSPVHVITIYQQKCTVSHAPAAWCPTVSMLWPRSLVSKQHKRFCTPNLCTPRHLKPFDS